MNLGSTLSGRAAGHDPRAGGSTPPLPLRFDRHELAGGLGDLALMIPLAVGVATAAHLSLASVFFVVAMGYAATALVFRVPVPVQPMKAMGASVIALGLSASVVTAASLEIAVLLLLIAFTPLGRYLGRLFPRPVVRGVQLAIGLLLMKSALVMAGAATALPGIGFALRLGPVTITAGLLLTVFIAAFIVGSSERGRLPVGLVVVGLGMVAGAVAVVTGVAAAPRLATAFALPVDRVPSLHDAFLALFVLVLPQVPLSLGNAVYATDDALHHYFGRGARRVTASRLCFSMGLMNVGSALLGGFSLCHGSGGATAHYRLGARTAGATLAAAAIYGVLAVGALLGYSPLVVPGAVLAGLLLFVGVEHCLLVADLVTVGDLVCAVLIAVVAIAAGNIAVGFLAGWAAHAVLSRTALYGIALSWPTFIGRIAPRPVTSVAQPR